MSAPERIWVIKEDASASWPGSFRRFLASDLDHGENGTLYLRADIAASQLAEAKDREADAIATIQIMQQQYKARDAHFDTLLAEARETNRKLNRRAQQGEGMFTSYRMSFSEWSKVLFKTTWAHPRQADRSYDDFLAWCRSIDVEFASGRAEAAEAERDRLAADNERWQTQSREGWEAFSAMRDTINEVVPMQSAEADLLNGPEMSVSCEVVAKTVVEYINRLAADNARLRDGIEGVVFHYFNCNDGDGSGCGQLRPAMAKLAKQIEYNDPSVNDEISTALAGKE